MIVLHLIGSPTSDFHFHCSIMYARSLFESDYVASGCNRNIIALIHTDGLWSFPTDLNEGLQDCKKKYKTADAMKLIEMLSPDVMVQHVHCEKRHTYSALFEILNIPIIGSDSQVSANIVDKGVTRGILTQAGVPMPEGVVVTRGENGLEYNGPFPAVVKPTKMENSVGVKIVRDKEEMRDALEVAWLYGDAAVIDTFKPGREVRCGAVELVNGKIEAVGCIEYKVAKDDIRAYEDKLEGSHDELRQAGTSWFIEKAEEPELVKKLQQIAVRIHRVMGCKDFSQYDCRVTEEGKVYVLEVNSFCSFGPKSLLPKLASREGISAGKLYNVLLERAASRGCGIFEAEFSSSSSSSSSSSEAEF